LAGGFAVETQQQGAAQGEERPRAGEFWRRSHYHFRHIDRLDHLLRVERAQARPRSAKDFINRGIDGVCCSWRRQRQLQRGGYRPGDLILERKHV